MMVRQIVSLLLAAFLAAPVLAGEPASPAPAPETLADSPATAGIPLPIAEATRKALDYSPVLKAMHSAEGAAAEKIGEARAMKGVRFNLSVDDTRLDSPMMAFGAKLNQGRITANDFFPDRLNDPGAVNNLRLGAQAVAPLHLGGMDRHAVAAAREGVKVSAFDTEKMRQEIIYQTIETYLGAVLAREMVTVAAKAVEASAESVRNAQAAVDAQRTVESDLLQARVHHSMNEENLLRRRNQYQLALEGLATIMGVPTAATFDLTMPFLQQTCTACREEPGKLLELALKQRPDYLKLARQESALMHQEKMFRGATRPHLAVGAAAEHNREEFGKSGHGNGMLFARVDWAVADGGESRHKALGARKQAQSIDRMAEAQADRIHLEIRNAITGINNALERIRVSREAVEQSRESRRILVDRYTAGLAIMSDLLRAETSLLDHQLNHLQALYDYALSKARLKMALGALTPEQCEILQTTAVQPLAGQLDGDAPATAGTPAASSASTSASTPAPQATAGQ